MRNLAFAVVLAAALSAGLPFAASAQQKDSCVECHSVLEDNLGQPAQLFADDIHRESGFSCADCHGGDPSSDDLEVSMDPARGFKGKISRLETPEMCGRCHSDPEFIHRFKPQQRVDQLVEYRKSVHGKRLAAGDEQAANCIDCHGVHGIREVSHVLSPVYPRALPQTCARCHADAEHMREYSISTAQFEEYETSVHWEALDVQGDLSAPTCATCHGNHGAAPPGVDSVAQVCGNCHIVFQRAFDQGPHKEAFEAMGLPACIACHANHAVLAPSEKMLGVDEGSSCVNCHSEGEAAFEVARQVRQRIDDLNQSLADSQEILDRAEEAGMEVTEGRLQWASANEQLIMARVQVHSFLLEPVEEAVSEGLGAADGSLEVGREALREMEFRRKGLALSLLTIAITMAGLWLAIRRLKLPA